VPEGALQVPAEKKNKGKSRTMKEKTKWQKPKSA